MAINWDKYIRHDRESLFFAAFLVWASALAALWLYFSKPAIHKKEDLTFIRGPFNYYSWITEGKGSTLTLRLRNYPDEFQITADFFDILETEPFKRLTPADTITIGIANRDAKLLNTFSSRILVYAVESNRVVYLDYRRTISKHNSPFVLIASGLFLIAGVVLIHFGRKAKKKTWSD